ncbi:MAG: 23S rRNA pseudouridine1911/1915/1917 synthase [Maribacter sp.]|jgi:23S rRNA pseudouridine1911/1915/1917 synthase
MIIINQHIVPSIDQSTRFLDYSYGLFNQLPSKKGVKKAIKNGELILNGKKVESGRWLKEDDEIALIDLQIQTPKPYEIALKIIYEDEYLAIINKPAGIVTSGNQFKTIENALIHNIKKSIEEDALKWAKPVHRLDAPTSGLLICSKTKTTHILLGRLFEEKKIQKTYQAIVQGTPPNTGTLSQDINGQKSITTFQVIKTIPSLQNGNISLLEVQPKTGRTHQIRIHLSQMGHPIIGDKLYGEEGNTLKNKGLFLAATGLGFIHPISQEKLLIDIDTPHKFESLMERELRRWKKFKGA